jgi:glycosyltransferase involved in cell wall biosynthesis
MKLADLNYHCHTDITDPYEVISLHAFSSGYIDPISRHLELLLIKHMAHEALVREEGVNYHFFKSRNRSWYIPSRTHRFLKKAKPDVILVQGFVFPLQVMALRRALGKNVKILLQHHGERPFKGIKGWLQRRADKSVSAYLFTAKNNARPWLDAGIISNENKCRELLSASSPFSNISRKNNNSPVQLAGSPTFLWVARLNENKDPLTVVRAFLRFLEQSPGAQLHMIYQTEELLPQLQQLMEHYPQWRSSIHFCGKKERTELEDWYNAADFYISGSHREGSGYALAEAMVCGCIPVVTNIPSFIKMTDDGKMGFIFEPGDADSCYAALLRTTNIDKDQVSDLVATYAMKHLGYEAVASQLLAIAYETVNHKDA